MSWQSDTKIKVVFVHANSRDIHVCVRQVGTSMHRS